MARETGNDDAAQLIEGILDRIDELLEVRYRSAPPVGLEGPLSLAVCSVLGLDAGSGGHQAALEVLLGLCESWEQLAKVSEADLARALEGVGFEPYPMVSELGPRLRSILEVQARFEADGRNSFQWQSAANALSTDAGLDEAASREVALSWAGMSVTADPFLRRILERLLGHIGGGDRDVVRQAESKLTPGQRTRIATNLLHHARRICRSQAPVCDDCTLISFCKEGQAALRADDRPVAVEFFAGAGGLAEGFGQAGFRVAVAVEIDRNAAQTNRANHPGTVVIEQDARKVSAKQIRDAAPWMEDVAAVIGGPPCQGYSIAGKRDPDDDKNDLFTFQVDIAAELEARFVVIENVPGMRQVKGVKFADRVTERFAQQSYTAVQTTVRASDYGVPQLRHRIIFIAQPEQVKDRVPAISSGPYCGSLYKPCCCGREKAKTVLERLQGLPELGPGVIAEYVPRALLDANVPLLNGSTMKHSSKVVNKIAGIEAGKGPISYRRLHKDLARTIVAGHRALPVHPTLNRTISVREAARIQGFPDTYVFCGKRGTQPLQVANAVPPPLAYAIADSLLSVYRGEVTAAQNYDACGPANQPPLPSGEE